VNNYVDQDGEPDLERGVLFAITYGRQIDKQERTDQQKVAKKQEQPKCCKVRQYKAIRLITPKMTRVQRRVKTVKVIV